MLIIFYWNKVLRGLKNIVIPNNKFMFSQNYTRGGYLKFHNFDSV